MGDKVIPVQVAVRLRPLVGKEIAQRAKPCISKVDGHPQVLAKRSASSDEAFTFDFVFGPEETQSQVFETAVEKLVQKIFQGYNVTILAYGQTGSGKSFTMGTSQSSGDGIIQQALQYLFSKMGEETDVTFEINVSFLEVNKSHLHLLNQSLI